MKIRALETTPVGLFFLKKKGKKERVPAVSE